MRGQVKIPPRFGVLPIAGVGVQLSEHTIKHRRFGYNLPYQIVYMYQRVVLLGEWAGSQADTAIMPAYLKPM